MNKKATPLQILAQGIENCDWATAATGFRLMFGTDLKPNASSSHGQMSSTVRELVRQLHAIVNQEPQQEGIQLEPESQSRARPARKTKPKAVQAVQPNGPRSKPKPRGAQVILENEEEEGEEEIEDDGGVGDRKCSTRSFRPRKNTFRDDGSVAANLIGDSKARSQGYKQKDYREPQRTVTKKCCGCGKKEKVPSDFPIAESGYRCNNCCKQGAGARS